MGILYGNSWVPFLVITLVLGGGAAWMTGRAVSRSWGPMWLAVLYMPPLAAATRFLHYALAKDDLVSLQYFLVAFVALTGIATLSWQVSRTTQLVTQYPWLYKRTSPLTVTDV